MTTERTCLCGQDHQGFGIASQGSTKKKKHNDKHNDWMCYRKNTMINTMIGCATETVKSRQTNLPDAKIHHFPHGHGSDGGFYGLSSWRKQAKLNLMSRYSIEKGFLNPPFQLVICVTSKHVTINGSVSLYRHPNTL